SVSLAGLLYANRNGTARRARGGGAAERTAGHMSTRPFLRLGSVKNVEGFLDYVRAHGLQIPCDKEVVGGPDSPLMVPLAREGIQIGNRIAVQPMEGWDGTKDGNPSELTIHRWRRFGRSGAKLIWGGEAVAISRSEERRVGKECRCGGAEYENRRIWI